MNKQRIIKELNHNKFSFTQLVNKLNSRSDEVEKDLEELEEEGIIFYDGKDYALTKDYNIFLGTVVTRKRSFAYIKINDEEQDYRLSGKMITGLIVGDRIYIEKKNNSNDCRFVGFYKRSEYLIGRYRTNGKKGYLECSNLDESGVKISITDINNNVELEDGDICKVKVNDYDVTNIYVTITERLISHNEVGAEISEIIVNNDANLHFPSKVLEEIKNIPSSIKEKDLDYRIDLRDKLIVTIDGEDALDFDDAVSIERISNAYKIGVHIADVSHYVKRNTAIDEEAYERGTSIYVADRVVPMLPNELSNGICSLNPDQDRLTISVFLYVDKHGNVFDSEIHESVIRSKTRMTYKLVNDLLEGKETDLPNELISMLKLLHEASSLVRKKREKKGCLNLDSTELKFKLDEKGWPVKVTALVQGEGEKMIEDLMIIANIAVAETFNKSSIPTIFRVHENPPEAKVSNLCNILKRFNLIKNFPATITTKGLNFWLDNIEDTNLHKIASDLLLRSLAKAKYSEENIGHFGLAEENYLHFTSPIRRYPDLIVHRLLKEYIIEGHRVNKALLMEYLSSASNHLSICERKAQVIERQVDDLESCRYYENKIGEVHKATITSLMYYGMYLELDDGIDALLMADKISNNETYYMDEKNYAFISTNRRSSYTIGQKLNVKIFQIDYERREILVTAEDFDSEHHFIPEEDNFKRPRSSHSKDKFHNNVKRNNFKRKQGSFNKNKKYTNHNRGKNENRRKK